MASPEAISGTVTDGGTAVNGALVIAVRTDTATKTVEGNATTDSNGDYSITNIPGGIYHVIAQWDDGTDKHNVKSKPFVNIPASISATTSGVTVATPTPAVSNVSFNPSNISSLSHWYDASDISGSDGDAIGTWSDSEGSAALTQSTSSKKPELRTSAINGENALKFDGTDDMISIADVDLSDLSQPNTIFIAFDGINNDGTVYTYADDANTRHQLDFNNNEWRIFAGSAVLGSTDGNSNIITAVFDESSSFVREDKTQTGSGDAGSGSLVDFAVGKKPGATAADMLVGEILIYNDALSSSDITDVEDYLSDKWGY